MISFTHRPLYLPGKCPRYPLYRRLIGPQSWSERCGKEKKIPSPAGSRTTVVRPVAQSLYWLSYKTTVGICFKRKQKLLLVNAAYG
jgi:hypothetical protein